MSFIKITIKETQVMLRLYKEKYEVTPYTLKALQNMMDNIPE